VREAWPAPDAAAAHFDARLKAVDGAWRWIDWTVIPLADAFYAVGRDVTERKSLEDQLRQSQKMEAVGQLTGGLAHDFNNMLTGIIGSLDMLSRRLADGRLSEASRYIETASAAATRAASLTHRLLAFSRRQALDPRPLDVNALVASMQELLTRTLGEQVALKVSLEPEAWPALTDENQLENAVLNLAINARDAMPGGGELTLETRNVVAAGGDYVSLRVRDTGVGMSQDVLDRVFDPFFTTKPLGQGTGLGLSMVYGFMRQTGGEVRIESRPGAGTTVELQLPRAAAGAAPQPGLRAQAPPGAGETVLVVEDDASVRLLVVEVLRELGYAAIEVAGGDAALEFLASARRIDLLVTDVGLPGLNGRQLAEIAREHRPDLPVLFMTGYAAAAARRSEFLGPGMEMIPKPFALDGLAVKIRQMIAG
jgi:signal transduction histidine kinase